MKPVGVGREDQTGQIQEACADSGYDTNLINQQLSERDIDFYTPERKGKAQFEIPIQKRIRGG